MSASDADEDSDDLYDVCVKVCSYGLHSPWNHHSFQRIGYFFVPRKCGMGCDKFVLFGQGACICLRCNTLSHRECTRNRVICLQNLSSSSPTPAEGSSYLQSLAQSVPIPIYEMVYSITRGAGTNSVSEDPSPVGELSKDAAATHESTSSTSSNPLPIQQQTLLLNRSPLLQPPPLPPPPPTRYSLPQKSTSSSSSSSSNAQTCRPLSLPTTNQGVPTLSKLPPPFSQNCIWSGSLKAVATRSNMITVTMPPNKAVTPEQSDEMNDLETDFFKKMLSDGNSFCGRVSVCLKALYLDIIFESPQESLQHAQGCLFYILHAVLHIYPSHIRLFNVVRGVENHVLGSYGMYEKIFTSAVLASHNEDLGLSLKISKIGRRSQSSPFDTNVIWCSCSDYFNAFFASQSPIEKLRHITDCLRHLAASRQPACSPSTKSSSPPSPSPSSSTSVSNTSPFSSSNPQSQDSEPIDTDTLVNRLREEIIAYTLTNTQMTSQGISRAPWSSSPGAFVMSIWYATCFFINALMHEDVLLGAEGYSFVTLQQALEAI